MTPAEQRQVEQLARQMCEEHGRWAHPDTIAIRIFGTGVTRAWELYQQKAARELGLIKDDQCQE